MKLVQWFKTNHHTVLPYVAAIVLGIWLWYSGKAAGRAEESLKQAKERIAVLTQIVDSQRVVVKSADSMVAVAETASAKIHVVYIDKKIKPKVDSAVAAIMAVLDDSMKAKLKAVVDGYEARLAVRDEKALAQEVVITALKSTVAERDRLIVKLDSLQVETKKNFDVLAKAQHHSLLSKIFDVIVPVGTLLLVAIK